MKKEEVHKGRVVRIDLDFTEVVLVNPVGDRYRRYFETEFLHNCGITSTEEEFELVFGKQAYGTYGIVIMYIKPTGEQAKITEEEVARLIEGLDFEELDLAKIKGAFGSIPDIG